MSEYVNNKVFCELLIKYNQTKSKKFYNELGKIFIKMATKYLDRPNLINYSFDRKQDMISDSVFYMSKAIKTFDTKELNPFGYFSKIIENCCLQYINKTKKRDRLFVRLDMLDIDDNLRSSNRYNID